MLLSATNHGDDTGATLALADNTGEASVFLSAFAGTNAQREWSLVGTIEDEGELELPDLELGPYTVIAANGSDLATPLSFRVSDSAAAAHWQCMAAVREYVLGLALPHVSQDPDDHVLVKFPYRPDLTLGYEKSKPAPDCCVMYFPRAETITDADNERNSIDYGVQLLIVRKLAPKVQIGLKSMLKIRELLTAGFTISPLPDYDEVHTVNVEPGQVILPEQWKLSYDCSTVVFRCLTEQPAGIF